MCAQVTAMASEDKLGVDFADVYANSGLAKCASASRNTWLTLRSCSKMTLLPSPSHPLCVCPFGFRFADL